MVKSIINEMLEMTYPDDYYKNVIEPAKTGKGAVPSMGQMLMKSQPFKAISLPFQEMMNPGKFGSFRSSGTPMARAITGPLSTAARGFFSAPAAGIMAALTPTVANADEVNMTAEDFAALNQGVTPQNEPMDIEGFLGTSTPQNLGFIENAPQVKEAIYQDRIMNSNLPEFASQPQYTIRGQIEDDFGEIKNKIGSGLGSIRDFVGSGINKAKEGIMDSSPMNFLRGLPTPGNLLMNMAATRNPLNPRASNYNPTLQGQIDYMKDKGMYGTNPNSGLGQITGGRLAGKNLVSLFGSNDLGEMYSKDLSKLEGYLATMPQRFSRLRKNDPFSYNKKIENLQNKIKQNKIEAQAAQAAREAATAARAMARNPEVYRNAGITSGGFASQNTGTNSNFSNRTGRGRTGYSEGGLASMFTRRG